MFRGLQRLSNRALSRARPAPTLRIRSLSTTATATATPTESSKTFTSADAERVLAQHVRSGDRVYLHMAAATPQRLCDALGTLTGSVTNVEVCHMHTEGRLSHVPSSTATAAEVDRIRASFRDNSMFIGRNVREAINLGRADYTPVFFSDVPRLFRNGGMPVDVALVTTSPPDSHGWMSLGTSVDCSLAAVQTARNVICQVNRFMPRTHGDGMIHVDQCTAMIHHNAPLHEPHTKAGGGGGEDGSADQIDQIGANVAGLIPDGACLQMGIGAIPDSVLKRLTNHKNLGVHSELFSDGVLPLVKSRVLNGYNKKIHPRALVATFLFGSRALYDFADDNPLVQMLDVAYVNDPNVIARNPLVHAINSAIEVDLTGQVCADTIGTRFYSGVGGQMDFMRGAALSAGGKPIIALPSQTGRGQSKIVPTLKPGAGVTTTRAHVHYVVTEYGVAELFGKTVRQRALALAKIAHPSHRDELMQYITKAF